MAANYQTTQWGITAPQFRHPSTPRSNLTINSKEDDKTILINSRDYSQSSGTSIGFQSRPNQAVAGASVHGCEIQPRFADGISGVDLVGANISAVLKGTTGNLSGAVHVLELETDFNDSSTRQITGNVDIIRIVGSFPSGMTFGKKSAIRIAAPNEGTFDALIAVEAGTGATATSGGSQDTAKWLTVLWTDGTTIMKIPLYAAS